MHIEGSVPKKVKMVEGSLGHCPMVVSGRFPLSSDIHRIEDDVVGEAQLLLDACLVDSLFDLEQMSPVCDHGNLHPDRASTVDRHDRDELSKKTPACL